MKSKQPRKQRKQLYNQPLHKRRKQVSARLSKELTETYKKRNIPVIKNDKVKILIGTHKGKTGKITAINLRAYTVTIEHIVNKKQDGNESQAQIHPSNIIITELNLNDEKRKKVLERK